MSRGTPMQILREATDTQHTAALTWQEAHRIVLHIEWLTNRAEKAEAEAATWRDDAEARYGAEAREAAFRGRVEALADEWEAVIALRVNDPWDRGYRMAHRKARGALLALLDTPAQDGGATDV